MALLQCGDGPLCPLFCLGEERGVELGHALGMQLFRQAGIVFGLLDDRLALIIRTRDDLFGFRFRIQQTFQRFIYHASPDYRLVEPTAGYDNADCAFCQAKLQLKGDGRRKLPALWSGYLKFPPNLPEGMAFGKMLLSIAANDLPVIDSA